MKRGILLLCLAVIAIAGCSPEEIPDITRRVTDMTGTLSDQEVEKLEQKLEQHEDETSNQIAVLIIKALDGRDLEELSMEIATRWAGGTKERDNGVLILIAKEDRKLRIEVGYGLEGALTDMLCGRIIDNEIAPFFKKELFYDGIDHGLNCIIQAIKGEYTGKNSAKIHFEEEDSKSGKFLVLLIFLGLVSLIACCIHRLAGGIVGGVGLFILVHWRYSLGWAFPAGILGFFIGLIIKEIAAAMAKGDSDGDGWSSGDSGDTGWSGGGGTFGGGGASGSW